MKKILLVWLFLFCFAGVSSAYTANKNIRIGIITKADSFTVAATDDYFVTDANGKKFKLTKGMMTLTYSKEGFKMGQYILKPPLKIESSNGIIYANKKAYRGYLTVNSFNSKAVVVNVLTVEDYLKGVLPKEASPGWGIEALKAQAVISRTYTLANMGRHGGLGFDLCDTTHCQVYGGAAVEALSCNKAIAATKNEVLTYDGKFAQTVFHANCGGHTEDPKFVWNWSAATPAYLKGVKCGYCAETPHAKWEKALDESFIREKLSKYGVGKIKSIKVKGVTPAGSAREIVIKHGKGTLELNAYKFRLDVDAWQVKSTTFDSIKKEGDKFIFKGRGWGHKVGLCQWGAKVMADKGKKYKHILEHYYPKTKIEKVNYK
ncbi:MAG: SpoIID/LytB domain-containing protein [Firmicutes bacterium]|nr:SpoIID/LytB domain-containing protein [Bacillota bacterium]